MSPSFPSPAVPPHRPETACSPAHGRAPITAALQTASIAAVPRPAQSPSVSHSARSACRSGTEVGADTSFYRARPCRTFFPDLTLFSRVGGKRAGRKIPGAYTIASGRGGKSPDESWLPSLWIEPPAYTPGRGAWGVRTPDEAGCVVDSAGQGMNPCWCAASRPSRASERLALPGGPFLFLWDVVSSA